jgi:hypothetical protein
LLPFGIFYGNLVSFIVIWYILWSFGILFSVVVCCTEKNLATLIMTKRKTMFTPKKRRKAKFGYDFFGVQSIVYCESFVTHAKKTFSCPKLLHLKYIHT